MLVARDNEKKILNEAFKSNQSQFIAIYGRRRIGKTYLVKECFKDTFTFSHAGIYKGTFKEQLESFSLSLNRYGLKEYGVPKDWLHAFHYLSILIENSKQKKKIIFLDELSWMSTRNSNFLKALEHFWNSFLSLRDDILLIVCASATSWILDNVVHNKGGLYNRLTQQIHLEPFTLKEIEEYLRINKINFTRKQIIEGYMILGGVPYYWGLMKKELSFASNIDYLFASKNAPLKSEYDYLYKSIFESPDEYIKIISVLAKRNKAGITREEILNHLGKTANGYFSRMIEELEECGFIRQYTPFGKKHKGTLIQLIDNFTLFYYKFLEPYPSDSNFFSSGIDRGAWNAWSGLAFERVCLLHIEQIKEALKIGGVKTNVCSFTSKRDDSMGIYGCQIDLLIIRKDDTINICEMKYSKIPYVVTEDDLYKMEVRKNDLINISKTDYSIIPTLIVSPSVKSNSLSNEFGAIIDLDALFN